MNEPVASGQWSARAGDRSASFESIVAKILHYRELVVWQKARLLVRQACELTKSYPTDERFGPMSQMRRAAVSAPTNIAEGAGTALVPRIRTIPFARGGFFGRI